MGDERTHTDHAQVELAEELDMSRQTRVGLTWNADHHAAAHLVPEAAGPQYAQPRTQ